MRDNFSKAKTIVIIEFYFLLLRNITKQQFFTSKKSIISFVYTLYICKELSKEIKQMLFTTTVINHKEQQQVEEVFEIVEQSAANIFVSSIAGNLYKQSIEDIANTKVGNKVVRNKNFKQMMQESFFYGANRFGTNFIA